MRNARPYTTDCPFWKRHVTLGKVLPDGTTYFCQDIGDKNAALQSMLGEMRSGISFFIAWSGQYTTDVFKLTPDDVSALIVSYAHRNS